MNRQFWGYSVLPILDRFAKRCRPAAPPTGTTCCPTPSTTTCATAACRPGMGNVGTEPGDIARSDIGLLFPERHFALFEALYWESYGSTRTELVRTREGVPHGHRLPPMGSAQMSQSDTPSTETAPASRPSLGVRIDRLFASRWGLVIIYGFFLGAYLIASGPRLKRHSQYNHFVYLAEGWLDGRLSLKGQPPNENDWARVEVLTLNDGRTVRGKFGSTGATDRFYFTRGGSETIGPEEIRSRDSVRYVSFPPFPAVPMLPFVAAAGLRFNDVVFTVLWAAFNPVLLFLLLRELVRRGYSQPHAPRRPVADRAAGRGLGLLHQRGAGAGLVHRPRRRGHHHHPLRLGLAGREVPDPAPGCCWASASPPGRRWGTCSRCSSGRRCGWRAAGRRCGTACATATGCRPGCSRGC